VQSYYNKTGAPQKKEWSLWGGTHLKTKLYNNILFELYLITSRGEAAKLFKLNQRHTQEDVPKAFLNDFCLLCGGTARHTFSFFYRKYAHTIV